MLISRIKNYLVQKELYRKNRFRLLLWSWVIINGLLILPIMTIASTKADDPLQSLPASLDGSVSSSTLPEYVIIRPSDDITFSSETSASISNLSVREGSSFKAGDILLQLDCRVQEAEFKKAKAQQDVAKLGYESAKKLKSYGSISELEFTQARSESGMADADVEKLGAIVEKCKIIAPFNGAVAELMVHIHETVKPGDPLLKIVNTENLDFEVQVPSTWLEWLRVDSFFNVHINEINKTVSVKIKQINPEIDSVSQTVKIIGRVVEPDSSLQPGMSGQASFPENPNNSKNNKKI